MEIICVPAIASLVYTLIEIYKKNIVKGNEKLLNFIPLIALVIGGIFGILMYLFYPQGIVASNEWIALIVGMASGLSSVGGNQIFKQLKKYGLEVKESESQKDEDVL